MRQLNFLLIFAVCLALVLFSLQNTQPTSIQIIEGIDVEAPLALELIIAMGLGSVLAWLFSVWTQLQRQLESWKAVRQIRAKEERIEALEQDMERYKAEIEEHQLPALSASEPVTEGTIVEQG
ncbi:MAG: lipopolysaccharide assembly protein LapA domain-containing protein [Coleofasciculus sp. G1-WW12-02]|uniref:lipopolysaccharide assembly protein LapA domain-containing protein n=1 Tax=Coleofasciculus sp. G1-WW12-02 TaxID=3068483 RepID=UPI0033010FDB